VLLITLTIFRKSKCLNGIYKKKMLIHALLMSYCLHFSMCLNILNLTFCTARAFLYYAYVASGNAFFEFHIDYLLNNAYINWNETHDIYFYCIFLCFSEMRDYIIKYNLKIRSSSRLARVRLIFTCNQTFRTRWLAPE